MVYPIRLIRFIWIGFGWFLLILIMLDWLSACVFMRRWLSINKKERW